VSWKFLRYENPLPNLQPERKHCDGFGSTTTESTKVLVDPLLCLTDVISYLCKERYYHLLSARVFKERFYHLLRYLPESVKKDFVTCCLPESVKKYFVTCCLSVSVKKDFITCCLPEYVKKDFIT
jgi:hypothetical protein